MMNPKMFAKGAKMPAPAPQSAEEGEELFPEGEEEGEEMNLEAIPDEALIAECQKRGLKV
jgi:hypothetical protein